MADVIQALTEIEAAARGGARLEKLKQLDSPELREVLGWALHPDITFGIKALPDPVATTQPRPGSACWLNSFRLLLKLLQKRELTGTEAQEVVANFLGFCSDSQRLWSERVLRQDLRLNLGAKDVNKALGEAVVPVFAVPLAEKVFDSDGVLLLKEKHLQGEWEFQPKLDGGRAVSVLVPGQPVRMLSRTGKEWGNFESIRKVLQAYNDRRQGTEVLYLDGEVISYNGPRIDFQNIQKTMMRKDGVETGRLQYIVFDIGIGDDWYNPELTYRNRYFNAGLYVTEIGSEKVVCVPCGCCTFHDPTPEILKAEAEKMVAQGYEGLIARRVDCPVELKRSPKLLKVKLFDDAEAEVIGVAEGREHTRLQGTLGALVCRKPDGVEFEIGSGFNPDSYRDELWRDRENLKGKLVSYAFFGVTDAKVPRHPIFRGFRSREDVS